MILFFFAHASQTHHGTLVEIHGTGVSWDCFGEFVALEGNVNGFGWKMAGVAFLLSASARTVRVVTPGGALLSNLVVRVHP